MSPIENGVTRCRSCDAPIVWGLTRSGKRCPFDVVDGRRTETSHFTTCPQAKTWSKRNTKAEAER